MLGIWVKTCVWLIDSRLQSPWVHIYILLKELQPDTTRTRIPNHTESVYKTIWITKENIKLSPRDKPEHLHRPIGNFPDSPSIASADSLVVAIGTDTSSPTDLVTLNNSSIGNHPHRQLILIGSSSYRQNTAVLSCQPTVYQSWTRAQKRCQHMPPQFQSMKSLMF